MAADGGADASCSWEIARGRRGPGRGAVSDVGFGRSEATDGPAGCTGLKVSQASLKRMTAEGERGHHPGLLWLGLLIETLRAATLHGLR